MIKTIAIIAFLSLGVTFNSYAGDSARIDRLEKEVQELKHRISEIESLLSNQSVAQEVVPDSEGWKSIANWRKLTTAMGPDDVKKILGEPVRVEGGVFTKWYYQNGGFVIIYSGKVYKWSEPNK